jgi:hypothetical protein
MRRFGRSLLAAASSVVLAACAQLAPGIPTPDRGAVFTRDDLSAGFVGFIGPKAQHAPPFLGTPETNFYCLRSFLDPRTGETTHQLYVSDSYFGAERNWNDARDASGKDLPFVSVSRDEITCEAGCSYVEEFAATLSESELGASPGGLAVTFSAGSGDRKTIRIPGERISAQLAAVNARRSAAQPVAAFGMAPP